jgi:two-component system OmpR family response regulator
MTRLGKKFTKVMAVECYTDLVDFNFDLVVFFLPIKQFNDPVVDFNEVSVMFKGTPIFVIDNRFNFNNRLLYLGLGAELYLFLPICNLDLLKYIGFYSVRKELMSKELLVYEDVQLDCDLRILKRGEGSWFLRNKEFELMKYFIKRPGYIISKNTLIEQIWDMNADFYNSKTVESHISYLRSKLDAGFEIKRLHTVHCVGYKFE